MSESGWPQLTLSGWADTRDTLHLWTQVVGKVKLALSPMLNHWWQVSLLPSARGLTTSLMHAGDRGVELEFDFVEHRLQLRTTDGDRRAVPLRPQTVAEFYAATLAALDGLGIAVHLNPMASEVPTTIALDRDEEHHTYDPEAAYRFWLALVRMHKVLLDFRARFIGKHSPIHLFWGGFDLASTRFSGRPAPQHGGGIPHCPDYVQVLAYSHEVSSCGYWPGGADEGVFYAYAYPEPPGYSAWSVREGAYDPALGEFLLPYTVVRTATDPEATLLEFFQRTYEGAADLAHWDRAALEVPATGWPVPS